MKKSLEKQKQKNHNKIPLWKTPLISTFSQYSPSTSVPFNNCHDNQHTSLF